MFSDFFSNKTRKQETNHYQINYEKTSFSVRLWILYQITEQSPSVDEAVITSTRGFLHDVPIRWVESQGCRWGSIGDKVNPQELNGDQAFRNP